MQDVQDCWVLPDQVPRRRPTEHLEQIKENLAWDRRTTTAHLLVAQAKQKHQYNERVSLHSFQEVDRILVRSLLFPQQATHELEGPFTVTRTLGPVNYKVHCGPRPYQLKVLHVNHLKKWHAPDKAVSRVAWFETQPPPLSAGELSWKPWKAKTKHSEAPPLDEDLTTSSPGTTQAVWHVIETPTHPGRVVRTTHRPALWKHWETMNNEVTKC